jgi:hypothetical protein
MIKVMKYCFLVLFFIISFYPWQLSYCADQAEKDLKIAKDAGSSQKPVFLPMPDPGKKVTFGNGYYLIYGFDKRPTLGTVIMKVEIFDNAGKKDTSLQVKANAGMPSMRGAHDTGEQTFALSKKGVYLLPISIVMPGDWEIKLTVIKNGNSIFLGRYNFGI